MRQCRFWLRVVGSLMIPCTSSAGLAAQQPPAPHVIWRDLTLLQSVPGAVRPVRWTLESIPAPVAFQGLNAGWLRRIEGDAVLLTAGRLPSTMLGAGGPLPVVTRAEWQNRRPPLPDTAIVLRRPNLAGAFAGFSASVESRTLRGGEYSYSTMLYFFLLMRTPTGWRAIRAGPG